MKFSKFISQLVTKGITGMKGDFALKINIIAILVNILCLVVDISINLVQKNYITCVLLAIFFSIFIFLLLLNLISYLKRQAVIKVLEIGILALEGDIKAVESIVRENMGEI